MERIWYFAPAAGLLLGSASPPSPQLPYVLAGLSQWDVHCRQSDPDDCVLVAAGAEPAASVALRYDVAKVRDWEPSCTQGSAAGCSTPAVSSEGTAAPADRKAQKPASGIVPPLVPAAPKVVNEAPPLAPAEARLAHEGVRIVISIPQQKAYVFEGTELVATSPVSTGKRGHETPAGTFPILQKKVRHHSNLYDNAPMPYMQRLTHSGVALHAGALPGYPASHGCIRLPWSFAKKLYGMTRHSTPVTITHSAPSSPEEALELA